LFFRARRLPTPPKQSSSKITMAPSQNNKKSRKGKGAGAAPAARQASRNPRADNLHAFRYRAKRDFFGHNQKKFLGKWSAENLKALEELVKKQATEKYATYPLRGKAKAAAEAAEKAKEVDEDEDEDEDEDDEMEDESQPEEVPWQVVGREPQSPGGTRKEAGNREVVSIFYILPSISNANYIASSATYPLRGKAKAAAEAAEKAKEVDEDEDEDEDEDDEMEDEGDDDTDHHLEDPSDDEDEGRRPAGNQSGVTAVLVTVQPRFVF
ncbi:hypothetical protein HYFRA_00012874, partial [Hymenoscyphus fraxineus]